MLYCNASDAPLPLLFPSVPPRHASLEPLAPGPPLEELRLALQEHAEAAGWAHTHAWLARGGSGTAAAGEH